MNRRKILTGLVALAAALPHAAHAQNPGDRQRRVGILMGYAENDSEAQKRLAALKQGLTELGWVEGRNLLINIRWSAGDVDRATVFARELVALNPDVVFCSTTPTTAALHRVTQTIPIVFTVVSDPVGAGFVKSLARPGGNITGFINLEASLVGKWLQLLKELAPRVTQVGVMFNPQTAPYAETYMRDLSEAQRILGIKAYAVRVSSDADIEKAIAGMARTAGAGLLVMTDSFMVVHRKTAITAAGRHKVPAIYFSSYMVEEGGLIGYGIDVVDLFRRAAPYVDRILRGAKAADLPIQQPTKFELYVNARVAKALGLTIPPTIMVQANKVIE